MENCKICQYNPIMNEIGATGRIETTARLDDKGYLVEEGIKNIKLYQCPECKTVVME